MFHLTELTRDKSAQSVAALVAYEVAQVQLFDIKTICKARVKLEVYACLHARSHAITRTRFLTPTRHTRWRRCSCLTLRPFARLASSSRYMHVCTHSRTQSRAHAFLPHTTHEVAPVQLSSSSRYAHTQAQTYAPKCKKNSILSFSTRHAHILIKKVSPQCTLISSEHTTYFPPRGGRR